MIEAKSLLRGVIDFGDSLVTDEQFAVNYKRLASSRYKFYNPDEASIWTIASGSWRQFGQQPNFQVLRHYFEGNNETTTVEKLLDIQAVPPLVRTHYEAALAQLVEAQTRDTFNTLIQDTAEIAGSRTGVAKGKGPNKVVYQGRADALRYLNKLGYDLIAEEDGAQSAFDLTTPEETQAEAIAYDIAKTGGGTYGKFTGLEQIDKVCRGIKPGELWVHAGFAGQLKTTFATNWAYNTVTRYRGNVLYVSLEMTGEHLRKLVSVMHTTNGAFRAEGYRALDYRKVRDGELDTPEDEAFFNKALKDFAENPEYHRFHVWVPKEAVTIRDIRAYAEQLSRTHAIDLIIIDHAGLVKPAVVDTNFTVRMNSIFREAKELALFFNRGNKVPVILLHQVNREGLKAAQKSNGALELTALSYANEAERSADVVTTTYLSPELRLAGLAKVSCLKNRDNDLFPTFDVGVEWGSRRLVHRELGEHPDISVVSDDVLNAVI